MLRLQVVFAVIVILAVAGSASAKDAVIKDGKVAIIELTGDVKAGELVLKPGSYKVQHRADGPKHLMHFWPVDDQKTEFTAEVECEMDPGQKTWRKTQVWLSGDPTDRRVTRIMLKGEKVAYVFK